MLTDRGYDPPIVVGGAAVELYSRSAVMTGDFDISTARQAVFEEALQALGFVRPSGAGKLTRGWLHPDLQLGFEVVASNLFDGLADRERLLIVNLDDDGTAAFVSIEDMIADRVAQFASGSAPEMLEQARALLALHSHVDRSYLSRRIFEETAGDYDLESFEADFA
ncbi:hypothetical protein [Sphingomonas panacis]|nr:hypothetical protein [Sphingomonas panacis]